MSVPYRSGLPYRSGRPYRRSIGDGEQPTAPTLRRPRMRIEPNRSTGHLHPNTDTATVSAPTISIRVE